VIVKCNNYSAAYLWSIEISQYLFTRTNLNTSFIKHDNGVFVFENYYEYSFLANLIGRNVFDTLICIIKLFVNAMSEYINILH